MSRDIADMRYAVTVRATEIMGRVIVTWVVDGRSNYAPERDKRVFQRTVDVECEEEPGSARWVREVLVAVIEHL